MSSLVERIDHLELDLRRVERELDDLRREVRADAAHAHLLEPAAVARVVAEPVVSPVAVASPAPPASASAPAPRPQPRRSADLGELLARFDLLGARGLAIAGGAVTALGITLLFALAAERGWIGPVARVGAGALVSAVVFGAGLVVHRRYGQYVAGLAAVGAGIAGGYATLAAASALYGLVPDAAALAIAAGIASVAVVVSLAWGSELVAALGLVGAALAPALEAADAGIGAAGVAFGVVVLAATAVVAIVRRWELLLAVVLVVVGAQAAWLVSLDAPTGEAGTLAVVAALAWVVLVAACGWQIAGGERAVAGIVGPLVLGDVGLLLLSGQALLEAGQQRGAWLACAAGGFGLCWLAVRRVQPDLALVVVAGALALAAVAVANLISDDGLTLAWAAQSTVFSALAYRFRDARLQLAALVYLGLSTAHLLVVTEPLGELFGAGGDWTVALPTLAVAAAAASAGILAPRGYAATGEVGALAFLSEIRAALRRRRSGVVETLLATAAALAVVAFGIVAVSLHIPAGHVALSGVAALVAVAGTIVAADRRARGLAAASLVASFVVLGEAFTYDLHELSRGWAGPSLLLAAAGLLASGVLLRVRWTIQAPLGLASGAAAVASFVGMFAALTVLVPDDTTVASRFWATAGSGAVALTYLSLAAWAVRQRRLRNLSTTLWALGLVALLVAELVATDGGQLFAIMVAVTAAVTTLVAFRIRELRLWIAAAVLLSADCLGVLTGLTPLDHLLVANPDPASGVVALLTVAAAGGVVAVTAPRRRRWILAGASGLTLYAVSLIVLELAIRISGASLETDFERGHTVVSAVWGLTGLTVLVLGVAHRSNRLRYAGLALFGVTLGKIFLFDLAELSSVARAASFVAVGGLLLVGGVLVQRLGEREPDILER
jgi:uncharacterized membrane protein